MADQSTRGYVVNDPDYGTITIGKGSENAQINVCSTSLASLRLFDDGHFQLASGDGGDKQVSDSILSHSPHGLHIKNTKKDGEIVLEATTIRLSARDIILDATGTDAEGISILSNQHIKIDATDNISIEGSQVAIGAKYKMFIGTGGPFILRGRGGVSIIEPKEKLIPTSINDVVDKVLSLVFPEYF